MPIAMFKMRLKCFYILSPYKILKKNIRRLKCCEHNCMGSEWSSESWLEILTPESPVVAEWSKWVQHSNSLRVLLFGETWWGGGIGCDDLLARLDEFMEQVVLLHLLNGIPTLTWKHLEKFNLRFVQYQIMKIRS